MSQEIEYTVIIHFIHRDQNHIIHLRVRRDNEIADIRELRKGRWPGGSVPLRYAECEAGVLQNIAEAYFSFHSCDWEGVQGWKIRRQGITVSSSPPGL